MPTSCPVLEKKEKSGICGSHTRTELPSDLLHMCNVKYISLLFKTMQIEIIHWSWNIITVLCSCWGWVLHITTYPIDFSFFPDFIHRTWLYGHPRLPWRHIWPLCKTARSKLQSAQVEDRCTQDKHIIIIMCCLNLSPLSLSLLVTRRHASLHQVQLNLCPQSIGVQSVIRTSKDWLSVRAGRVPHWGRIKGTIDKCDMLIWGQNRRKDSSVRTWRNISWQLLQRGLPFQQQGWHSWSGK